MLNNFIFKDKIIKTIPVDGIEPTFLKLDWWSTGVGFIPIIIYYNIELLKGRQNESEKIDVSYQIGIVEVGNNKLC